MKTLLQLVVFVPCGAGWGGVGPGQGDAEKPMVSQDPLTPGNKFAYARVKTCC